MKSNVFKIKEGKTQQWKDWCVKLNTIYRTEAIETLKEEKVTQEAFFFFTINNQDYTMSMVDGEALPSTTTRELNIEHRKNYKECLEKVSTVEVLYHLKLDDLV